jgi:hypothetical protein
MVYVSKTGHRYTVGADEQGRLWHYRDGIKEPNWGWWKLQQSADGELRRRARANEWTEVRS